MTVTNQMLITYILANRMHNEAGQYLLQDKVQTMGPDALGSARAFLFGRFLHAGETTVFDAWIVATFTDLIEADLADLETIRAAYLVSTGVLDDTNVYVMLFEALIKLTISYIWQASNMENDAKMEQKDAQALISAIVGSAANPDNVLGGTGGDAMPLQPVVSVDILTEAEITESLGGYE